MRNATCTTGILKIQYVDVATILTRLGARGLSFLLQIKFFLNYTVQLKHSQSTHTHTSTNTHTQTLPLSASLKNEPANSRDRQSHHRRLVVDGNVTYH